MPVSLRFRCQYCDEQPDPLTQINLVTAMRQTTFGAYQDALPGVDRAWRAATTRQTGGL